MRAAIEEVHAHSNQHPAKRHHLRTVIQRHDHSAADDHSQNGHQRHERCPERTVQIGPQAPHHDNAQADKHKSKECSYRRQVACKPRRYESRKGADENATLPSYAEYVATGRYSIGGPPHIWAALITSDDASTPKHLDHLRGMEELASTGIRLANDLQSYQKEIQEGKINALVILSRALRARGASQTAAYTQAEAHVRADIEAGLDRLTRLRDSAVTATARPEAAIDNIARFVCDFYTHHDYHTFLAQAA